MFPDDIKCSLNFAKFGLEQDVCGEIKKKKAFDASEKMYLHHKFCLLYQCITNLPLCLLGKSSFFNHDSKFCCKCFIKDLHVICSVATVYFLFSFLEIKHLGISSIL